MDETDLHTLIIRCNINLTQIHKEISSRLCNVLSEDESGLSCRALRPVEFLLSWKSLFFLNQRSCAVIGLVKMIRVLHIFVTWLKGKEKNGLNR